jgi:hypothetical protein
MIAYVFWHAPQSGVDPVTYEDTLIAFHRALSHARPPGLSVAWTERVETPWHGAAYADWYVLDGFGALEALNRAAVEGATAPAHRAIAELSGAGAGSLFGLLAGPALPADTVTWVSKPRDISYELFLDRMPAATSIWRRQLVLGPTPEFAVAGRRDIKDAAGRVVTRHTVIWQSPALP